LVPAGTAQTACIDTVEAAAVHVEAMHAGHCHWMMAAMAAEIGT
jgi:hypothetical protein